MTLSSVRWYGGMTWAFAETSRDEQSTPRAVRPSISLNSTDEVDDDAVADDRDAARA